MLSKWLHGAGKQEAKNHSNGNHEDATGSTQQAPAEAPRVNQARTRPNGQAPRGPQGPQGNLLPLEDIYRATGLVDLRTGYNIQKVVDMLSSGHIRNLSDDMRRASVLMALDAAGVSVDDILRDARVRLEALSRYESDQQKRLEEYEALKLRENAGIQQELDQLTEHYKARMKSNLEDVARLREPFAAWQGMKEQEMQRISEAMGLCSKRAEPAAPAVAAAIVPSAELRAALAPVELGTGAMSVPESDRKVAGSTAKEAASEDQRLAVRH